MVTCQWKPDEEGTFDTTCGHKFQFFDGGPMANLMKFCCYCGETLVEMPVDSEPEDED